MSLTHSEHELLDLVLHLVDLRLKICFCVKNGTGYNVAGHSTGSTKLILLGYIDVWNILNQCFIKGLRLTLSSQRSGRWRMISSGSVSAARTTKSASPLFRALVVSFAPFFNYIIWQQVSTSAINSIIRKEMLKADPEGSDSTKWKNLAYDFVLCGLIQQTDDVLRHLVVGLGPGTGLLCVLNHL